mmetsp:Transcript_11912/g.19825  ORF Transcript_11912/g.19825 Transcript_11912/m.19825 type:complete len:96 (+) Transcript_11912:297-584(+)
MRWCMLNDIADFKTFEQLTHTNLVATSFCVVVREFVEGGRVDKAPFFPPSSSYFPEISSPLMAAVARVVGGGGGGLGGVKVATVNEESLLCILCT